MKSNYKCLLYLFLKFNSSEPSFSNCYINRIHFYIIQDPTNSCSSLKNVVFSFEKAGKILKALKIFQIQEKRTVRYEKKQNPQTYLHNL